MEPGEIKETALPCPQCRRLLRSLRRPACPWCGAALPDADYQSVALPENRILNGREMPPIPNFSFGTPQTLFPNWLSTPRTPLRWEGRAQKVLIVVQAIVGVCVAAFILHTFWTMHLIMKTLPVHPH